MCLKLWVVRHVLVSFVIITYNNIGLEYLEIFSYCEIVLWKIGLSWNRLVGSSRYIQNSQIIGSLCYVIDFKYSRCYTAWVYERYDISISRNNDTIIIHIVFWTYSSYYIQSNENCICSPHSPIIRNTHCNCALLLLWRYTLCILLVGILEDFIGLVAFKSHKVNTPL